jgi:hypothetical protein
LSNVKLLTIAIYRHECNNGFEGFWIDQLEDTILGGCWTELRIFKNEYSEALRLFNKLKVFI